MISKLQNTKDMAYYNDSILCANLTNKWVNEKPNNKELKAFQQSLINVLFYTNDLQTNLANTKLTLSMYRHKRNEIALKFNELQSKMDKLDKHFIPSQYELEL